MLSCFPHLTNIEYISACSEFLTRFHCHGHTQDAWLAVNLRTNNEMSYLQVTKSLCRKAHIPAQREGEDEMDGLDDEDDEALNTAVASPPIVNYDIFLSPTYCVPVLYISISDAQHRYPPTFAILHEHVIPPQFRAQIAAAGFIGGVTLTDHPVTNRPVFFIHPCQTADVMEAAVGKRDVTAEEYLIAWIGALGKFVGLDVPLALVSEDQDITTRREIG